jgi:hypothetical protein
VADAEAMAALLRDAGFAVTFRTNDRATTDVLKDFLDRQAKKRVAGETVVVYIASHGTQLPDDPEHPDETEGMDDAFLFYNRMLIDDELYDLWEQFQTPGVRIVFVTDSCTSGTAFKLTTDDKPRTKFRAVRVTAARKLYDQNRAIYQKVWAQKPPDSPRRAPGLTMKATAVHLAASPDRVPAKEVNGRGLFTTTLIEVWAQGTFSGNYKQFAEAIQRTIPDQEQEPLFSRYGPRLLSFEGQRPFTK